MISNAHLPIIAPISANHSLQNDLQNCPLSYFIKTTFLTTSIMLINRRLLYILIFTLIVLILLVSRVNHGLIAEMSVRSPPRLRRHYRPTAVKWPFSPKDERDLLKMWPATCPRDTLCISVGTPLYHAWKHWLEFNNWYSKFNDGVKKCTFVSDPLAADAVVFHGLELFYDTSRILRIRQLVTDQVWVYFSSESPALIEEFVNGLDNDARGWRHLFNWTATYQRNSDIYAPYGAIEKKPSQNGPEQFVWRRKYLAFVVASNCRTSIKRSHYLRELRKHMELHIFGKCEEKRFPYESFTDAAHHYYFYLAFENTRCKDYITEKFWTNALNAGVVPVVFGAPVHDYHDVAPPGSFIAGESFRSIEELASYLKTVAADPKLYDAFFQWRKNYRLSLADKAEGLFRKLCDKLHSNYPRQTKDLFDEWHPDRCCNRRPWL